MTVLSFSNLNSNLTSTMADLTLKEVKKLACSKNSCIMKKEKQIQLLIQPCYANSLKKGIKVAMDNLSIGFCQHVGGLVLGYENVKVLPWSGSVHSTNPLVHLHVRATFYVFAPTKGLLIEGIVNKVTPHMVSFLAYNKYNIIYRVHQVRQELRQRAVRSGNSEAADSAKLVLQHLQNLNLTEGMSCMLLLQEVALRDFLPSLLGYPVPEGLDASSMEDLSVLASVVDPPKKKVRFSDEDSVDSAGSDTRSSEQPPPHRAQEAEKPWSSEPNGSLETGDDVELIHEVAPSQKTVRSKEKRLSQEKASTPGVFRDEDIEVISPCRSLSDSSFQMPSPSVESSKTKKKKKSINKRKDANVEALAETAALAAVIESSRLCHAGDDDRRDLVPSALCLANGGSELQSPAKKTAKRKRDESSEGEVLQRSSKKPRKSKQLGS